MAVYHASVFVGSRVVLDGNEFVDCMFDHCTLVYGGGPLRMNGNNLSNINWEFTDAAARTTALLANLYRGGGVLKDFVERLLSTYGKPSQPPLTNAGAGEAPATEAKP